MNGPGPHKLKPLRKRYRRVVLDPPLVNTFSSVAGLLQLWPGKTIELLTAREALFVASVNHGRRLPDGTVPIRFQKWIYVGPGDWGFNRTIKWNYFFASYARALDAWCTAANNQ